MSARFPGRGRRALGPLACAMLFLSAWLLLPRPTGEGRRDAALRCCLVDASASAYRTRDGWLRWVRSELRGQALLAREAGEDFAVIVFAAEVTRAFPPADPEEFLDRLDGRRGAPFDPRVGVGQDGATRLAGALTVALEGCTAPERKPGQVVLLGTGDYTGADPASLLRRLDRAGCRFERHTPAPPDLSELALLELDVPPFVEADAPLAGRARLSYRPGRSTPTSAALWIEVEGASGTRAFSIPLELPPAGGRFEVALRLGAVGFGRTVIRANAQLGMLGTRDGAYGDPIPENNRLEAITKARGELVIGAVAEPLRDGAARRWLTPSGHSSLQGVQWVFASPEELPALIEQLDAVISFDLAPRELPQGLLENFVRRGGGYLATAGWGFLKDWFPGRELVGLARLLPLEPSPRDSPPREVVLLVDGSGSMAGEPFELVRGAALDLVAAALPSDRVSLRFFRTGLGPARLIKSRTESAGGESGQSQTDRNALEAQRAARRLIELEVPEGSTFVLSSLEHFAEAKYEDEVLALLLTDGEDREGIANFAARTAALQARLRASRKRVVVVAISAEERALSFLRDLVPDGEEVLRAEKLSDLQGIFRQEVSGAQVRFGDIAVHVAGRRRGSLAYEIEGRGGALPNLGRLVRNRLREGAEVLWESDRTEPILAAMRVSSGRTACLSSLPYVGWAGNYTDRAGLGEPRLFAALLRWLARRGEFAEPELEVRVEGEELWVAGFDSRWPPGVGAKIVGAARDEELADVVLLPPAPPLADALVGSDPRRVRCTTLSRELRERLFAHPALLRIPHTAPGEADLLLPLSLPRAAEFGQAEKELILPFSSGAGPVADRLRGSRRTDQHPLGPMALAAGLGLLFAAALLRSR